MSDGPKVWEETWRVAKFEGEMDAHIELVVPPAPPTASALDGPGIGRLYYRVGEPVTRMSERARLAACAPEAMRLLLEAEWKGGAEEGCYLFCPWCLTTSAHGSSDDHAADCRWLALMRKAGVR